jgi:tol-pal system protein YbgF
MTSRSIAAAALLACCALAVPAAAQQPELRELVNRMERMQRELTTLQQQVYRGQPPPTSLAAEASSADSGAAARLSVRINQLETELRSITGKTEEIEHAVRQLTARIDKLAGDLESKQPPHALGPGAGGSAASRPPQSASTAPPGAPEPGTLGVLPKSATAPAAGQAAPQVQKAALPPGTPQQQYDYAISLMLQQQNFAEAERALKEFVAAHPDDPRAGSAHYWLGETYFVRKDYEQAAFVFADAFQKYPDGQKAPDSLFKLGKSLAELGKTKEACTAYERLVRNYPKATPSLKNRIDVEQRRLKCRA